MNPREVKEARVLFQKGDFKRERREDAVKARTGKLAREWSCGYGTQKGKAGSFVLPERGEERGQSRGTENEMETVNEPVAPPKIDRLA